MPSWQSQRARWRGLAGIGIRRRLGVTGAGHGDHIADKFCEPSLSKIGTPQPPHETPCTHETRCTLHTPRRPHTHTLEHITTPTTHPEHAQEMDLYQTTQTQTHYTHTRRTPRTHRAGKALFARHGGVVQSAVVLDKAWFCVVTTLVPPHDKFIPQKMGGK